MKKRKLTKAELEAEANFAKLQAKWDRMYGKITQKKLRPAEIPKLTVPPGRESLSLKSKVTPGGDATVVHGHRYSGTKIIGIATMHKSSMVPISSKEEAVEVSTMRRS